MPDTSRTLAAIKTLFADGSFRGVPQAIRDLAESIAHPVAGGGFDTMPYGPDNQQVLYSYLINSNITIPNLTYNTHLPFVSDTQQNKDNGYLFDPQGWIQRSSTYTSTDWTGQTYQPDEWILLPEGLYVVHIYAWWHFMGLNDDVGNRVLSLATVDTRAGTAIDEPFDWSPCYALEQSADFIRLASAMPKQGGTSHHAHFVSAFIRVRSTVAPVPFTMQASHNAGSDMQIRGHDTGITIYRISDQG